MPTHSSSPSAASASTMAGRSIVVAATGSAPARRQDRRSCAKRIDRRESQEEIVAGRRFPTAASTASGAPMRPSASIAWKRTFSSGSSSARHRSAGFLAVAAAAERQRRMHAQVRGSDRRAAATSGSTTRAAGGDQHPQRAVEHVEVVVIALQRVEQVAQLLDRCAALEVSGSPGRAPASPRRRARDRSSGEVSGCAAPRTALAIEALGDVLDA